jgi:hypothetical protein
MRGWDGMRNRVHSAACQTALLSSGYPAERWQRCRRAEIVGVMNCLSGDARWPCRPCSL